MKRLPELFFAILIIMLGLIGWLGYDRYQSEVREAAPATDWFIVNRVRVPDHQTGENPDVIYERRVFREFTGDWFVKFYYLDKPGVVACHGEGSFRYKPPVNLPKNLMPLSVFIGKECGLKPGCYYGDVHWDIYPDGYPKKTRDIEIPQFCVKP